MGLGLVTALLLNREFPWRGLARALIIIPWALPSVVIALMWRWIYDPNTGVLNDILIYLSIVKQAVPWLADPDLALYAIIATLTWQGFPFFAVMILAGLQGIPKSQYEAASIDGASPWRQFLHITLPGIAPVLGTAGLLRVIWVANSMDVIFVMTGGGPGYATHTLPLYAFIRARQNLDFGYGTCDRRHLHHPARRRRRALSDPHHAGGRTMNRPSTLSADPDHRPAGPADRAFRDGPLRLDHSDLADAKQDAGCDRRLALAVRLEPRQLCPAAAPDVVPRQHAGQPDHRRRHGRARPRRLGDGGLCLLALPLRAAASCSCCSSC